MICEKDNALMRQESWAKKTGANEYQLFERYTCLVCKLIKIEDVTKVNKNTDKTRKILADMKAQAIAKIPKISLRSPVKEDVDVASLFNKKK